MTKQLLKIALSALFGGFLISAQAQVASGSAAAGTNTVPGKEVTAPVGVYNPQVDKDKEARKASAIVKSVSETVTLTEEQKTRIQNSMEVSLAKFDAASANARDNDAKMKDLKGTLVNDMKANLKSILTADQYQTVVAQMASK